VKIENVDYRAPRDLRSTPTQLRRALVVGSCLADGFVKVFAHAGCPTDYVVANHFADLARAPPRPLSEYDFQFIQLPLRTVFKSIQLTKHAASDLAGHRRMFEEACERVSKLLEAFLVWHVQSGLLTFVSNFLTPQQNPVGRLLPRYDLRNPAYFVEQLNVHLARELEARPNVHLIDVDQVAANVGRRFVQDDMVWPVNHGSGLNDEDHPFDLERLEPIEPVGAYYPYDGWEFCNLVWREVEASFRTIAQVDQVKMVLVDLDDTLWRGVLAETGSTHIEGWPLGLVEALLVLKRRGLVLGIVSRNDEAKIAAAWEGVFQGRLRLDDFAIRRINWSAKVDNIAEILSVTNLLPKSVVFIDDSPVEREAVRQAFPEMRVLGENPYLLRRILLWSPETQVAQISDEAARRTETVQAQEAREQQRQAMSRDEILRSLEVEVSLFDIRTSEAPEFARAIELINRTNQFNTTGERRTAAEAARYVAEGGSLYAFSVRDRFTNYGLVGVFCVKEGTIEQFVMSCRVAGLDADLSAVELLLERKHLEWARLAETPDNGPVRDLWSRCGFVATDEGFRIEPRSVAGQVPHPGATAELAKA
jgi:FkbH-like protein